MAISVVMPALEMAQETGKLISWLKKEGESVSKGEMLLEIETDKAVMEIEAPADGILAGIRVQPGAEVPVGHTIAWIVAPGEAPPEEAAPITTGRRSDSAKDTGARIDLAAAAEPETPAAEVRISPKARRLAKEHGVDLGKIEGTGPGGEILAADILPAAQGSAAASAATASAVESSSIQPGPVARLMAERTRQSWTTVPHFFVRREVDATALNAARQRLLHSVEQGHQVKLTHTDLLVGIIARTLAGHPRINASWVENGIRLNPEINVAVAMAVDDGVVAPVIRNADKLEIGLIAAERARLTERARAGKLRPSDLSGGTFTISNLGMFQVDAFSAIITPPQAAIVAVGSIMDRVVAYEGKPAVRPMMSMTLSNDHRVIDGAGAAKFLQDLASALESL
jgi:pyruvate dehydrogenase E2 component (dihydrolipoamide acetyltransferase)